MYLMQVATEINCNAQKSYIMDTNYDTPSPNIIMVDSYWLICLLSVS